MSKMTPPQIVEELDKHIIGQAAAKRAVAIALRNRWRRSRVDKSIREEITPKNILMIGPTGVGKTEIARRLAKLSDAPFLKVEATKFTEVGYVGRDVDSIIRDLMEIAIKQAREKAMQKVQARAEDVAEERILDILLPTARTFNFGPDENLDPDKEPKEDISNVNSTRQKFRKKLREGNLDDKEIEIEVKAPSVGVEIMAPPGMEEMTSQLQGMFQNMGNTKKHPRKMTIAQALKVITDEEAGNLLNEDEVRDSALYSVEENGIVFLDEMDKIAKSGGNSGADVSREGVQRDLLPLVEGSTVTTKYGMIKTDHILFIASGAFHLSKPSDLIPELQGRFPIRVELDALTSDDFVRILTEPDASLTEQYSALLDTEDVQLIFTADGVKRLAEMAWQVNERTENIGARRLHTILERLLEDISFSASDRAGETLKVTAEYVNENIADLAEDEDLSRYIL